MNKNQVYQESVSAAIKYNGYTFLQNNHNAFISGAAWMYAQFEKDKEIETKVQNRYARVYRESLDKENSLVDFLEYYKIDNDLESRKKMFFFIKDYTGTEEQNIKALNILKLIEVTAKYFIK